MSNLKTVLWAFVTADAGVAALIADRLYPAGEVPASAARPYITYQMIDSPRERHQGGACSLYRPRVQFDIWADSELEAAQIADALEARLEAYTGSMVSGGITVSVRRACMQDENDAWEPPQRAEEKGIFRITQDYVLWHI